MSRFLQLSCKLNTHRIVTCPFRFLRNYYGDFPNVMFFQIPKHFLPFLMMSAYVFLVFLRLPLAFLVFPLSIFPVSYCRFCVKSTY